jgi:hypothetical protein
VKWTFIGKYEALMFSAQFRSQELKMRKWKAEIVWSRVNTLGTGNEKKIK